MIRKMKDLGKKIRDGVTTLTCEQEKELVNAWLKYDNTREKAASLSITGELAELIAAISKYERGPADRTEENWLNIAEEIADVQIVTTMAKILYGVDDELLSKIRTLKLTVPIPETDDTKTDRSSPETDNKKR